MASSTNNHLTFLVLLFLFLLQKSPSLATHLSIDGLLPFAPKHVTIFNKLTTRGTLVAHCMNKETDLGIRKLPSGGSFAFRFHVNLRRTTTYNCTFEWPGNRVTFDIFRADRDDSERSPFGVCRECIWYIYEPAPCREKRDGTHSICFSWD
ncbi:hypothetical protein CARUB_v10011983mg [Capsella rubella]|uniref:S-protein homolog n=1 Tax=Capsella rubella TaxID=81985 RepID=R0IHD4_9BRAS|nr:S-protein homolog 5 [Capsella rubella]EOA37810.1 hypothetical protein CARUB_v10011983mg [Capsella rubella]